MTSARHEIVADQRMSLYYPTRTPRFQCHLREPSHIPSPMPTRTAPVSFFRSVIGMKRVCWSVISITPTGIAHTASTRPSTVAINYFCNRDDRFPLGCDGFAVDGFHAGLAENTFFQ